MQSRVIRRQKKT